MKKKTSDFFAMSRRERVGFIGVLVLIALGMIAMQGLRACRQQESTQQPAPDKAVFEQLTDTARNPIEATQHSKSKKAKRHAKKRKAGKKKYKQRYPNLLMYTKESQNNTMGRK